MMWAIKHKSGRVLFVTGSEVTANNRREMRWIVKEVKMTSREQFEAWFKSAFNLGDDHLSEGEFGSETAQTAWMSWQASRAAIEIELPEPFPLDTNPQGNTYYYESEVDEAIESAGLKVKK